MPPRLVVSCPKLPMMNRQHSDMLITLGLSLSLSPPRSKRVSALIHIVLTVNTDYTESVLGHVIMMVSHTWDPKSSGFKNLHEFEVLNPVHRPAFPERGNEMYVTVMTVVIDGHFDD